MPLHALSLAEFHSLPLLGESGHMCSRQVSCLLSSKHRWSFSCAATGSSLTTAPREVWIRGAGCLAQIASHMIISTCSPSKQPFFPHELLFQLSAPRVVGMGAGILSFGKSARMYSHVGAAWPAKSRDEVLTGFGYNCPFPFERFPHWRDPGFHYGFSKSVFQLLYGVSVPRCWWWGCRDLPKER